MTSYVAAFNTYKVIVPRNMYLGDNKVVQSIQMGSIVVEATVKDNINQFILKICSMCPNCMAICFCKQTCVEHFEGLIQSKLMHCCSSLFGSSKNPGYYLGKT